MERSVVVVIPSQKRPMRLLDAVESAMETTPPDVRVVCVLDVKDKASVWAMDKLEPGHKSRLDMVLVSGDLHTAERWNAGAAYSAAEYIVTGADDIIFEPGWLEEAMRVMVDNGGHGVVGLNEGDRSAFGHLATHFLVSRKFCAQHLGGSVMIPVYEHGWTDMEVTMRASLAGKLFWAEDARFTHNHPHYSRAEMDEIYEKGRSSHDRDQELYGKRARAGFPDDFEPVIFYESPTGSGWGKVAVALRTNRGIPELFIANWSLFLMHGLRPGDRLINPAIQMGFPHHVSANKLVSAFLRSDCDSLLLVDDDMIIPQNALHSLRDNKDNWEYDIVQAFCTHKTFPPRAVAMRLSESQPELPHSLAGEHFDALAISEDGVYEVDAVGAAFTLVKRHVFEHMVNEHGVDWTPWFDFGKHSEMEDTRFSRRCREANFRMAVDTSAKIGHLGVHTYGWNEHLQLIKMLESNKQWQNSQEKI